VIPPESLIFGRLDLRTLPTVLGYRFFDRFVIGQQLIFAGNVKMPVLSRRLEAVICQLEGGGRAAGREIFAMRFVVAPHLRRGE